LSVLYSTFFSHSSPSDLKKAKVKDMILKQSLTISRNTTFIKTNSLKQATGVEVKACGENLKDGKHPRKPNQGQAFTCNPSYSGDRDHACNPTNQEAEIMSMWSKASPWQIVHKTLS
jgi:hypothetical protein